jgi:hypothetical protein
VGIQVRIGSLIAPLARLMDQKIPIVGRLVTAVAAEISEKLGYEKSENSKAVMRSECHSWKV